MLHGLKEKEKIMSLDEAKVLKKLDHQNIGKIYIKLVKYIDSFYEDDVLIIIMEYCEEGDLAFHIKRKRNSIFF
jgi:NIMA (never in mitosis gene a)-related kinase